ncbi:MAG: hypothetical protein ACTSSP_07475 [Candidatus Asgardarchaeia archaeon]
MRRKKKEIAPILTYSTTGMEVTDIENYIRNLEPEGLLGLFLRVRNEIMKRMKSS